VNTETHVLYSVQERLGTVGLEQQDRGLGIPRAKDGQEGGANQLFTGLERVTQVGRG
jgi:hypothetical protein